MRYSNDETFRSKVKETSKGKYLNDEHYRTNLIQKGVEKYALDAEHRMTMKQKSIAKYQTDESHRQDVKSRSKTKYRADITHKENVKRMSTQKYKLDDMHKEKVKRRSTEKYKADDIHRRNVKKRSIEKYKLDEDHREKVKIASKASYHLSSEAKRLKKEKVSKKRQERMEKLKGEGEVVNFFRNKIKQGPEYTCCCCHRLLFENQVRGCTHEMYTMNHQARNVADLCIGDKYVHQCGASCTDYCPRSTMWVCFTCHRKIMSGKIPQEAAINKMSLEEIPPELSDLNSLEQHLIALHIPFMKVMSLPQGGQRNVHGPVVCVPSNIKKTTSLPLNNDENLLLRVKLKRKLSYKGYFEYQFVSPRHIKAALEFLKKNNKWYQEVSINSNWTENDDQCLMSDSIDTNESNHETPEIEINHNQEVASDTCLQPVDIAQEVLDHYFDDVFNIAPGEGQNPVKMLQEEGNEAKSFPHLFPSGRFSWNEDRDERITLSRYFNNRLMNTDNRFAKDTNYIFFAQFMSELKQVIEKTQISVRKSLTKSNDGKLVTSDMLQDPIILSKLFKNDEALRFMQPIRGTPAYWSTTQKDLFAMLRQLGIPTWFCSFSAAEFRWNEIVGCILHHDNDNRNSADLDWSEKSEILRRNPVTVARMFEHRFHVFQKEVILSPANPIGNVVDYFIRVEFQQRGSPHMHCLYWVEDAPKFGEDSEERVCDFIDKYVSCSLPSENDEQDLRQAVLSVQQHSKNHSKSCRKKGTECRFNFPRPPSERTFIAELCEEDAEIPHTNMQMNTSQAKDTLLNVWNKVLDDNSETQTTEEIFADLSLSQEDYEKAHRVLASRTTTILKRDPVEMWTNQYNECLLKCWDANMDIQYVLDPYSCIVYIISYISKAEREMGMLLKQTKIEATEGNLSAKQTMKKIGSAYLNHREVSAQEAVYRVCNLKMKECSRKVVFIPVGENPTRLSKPLSQLKTKRKPQSDEFEGDEDEEDIWMTNIVERYENRPQTDYFNQMCLAEFCSKFRVLAKSQVPQGEKEGIYELRNGKGYIQKRTRGKPAVIRYPRFNAESAPEKYFQSILQLFLPYINQRQLKPPGFDLYESFYSNGFVRVDTDLQAVKDVVNGHRNQFSKDEEAIENAAEIFELIGEPEDAWASLCPETEMKREECLIQKSILHSKDTQPKEVTEEVEREDSSDVLYHIREASNSRQEMLPLLQSLNDKQKEVFYSVREWCLKKISQENPEPLHVFITGGAGTGKSHLIKAIHYEASRLLGKTLSIPNAISILLTAFTGTAAFNIGGSTIHHVFSLTKALPIPYEPLKEQTLSAMRSKLENVQILIIDEVSMVFKRLMYYIHERLVQIKKCKQPFGGISVIAVGDFYQLPPVKQRKDERLYKVNDTYPVDYWLDFFKIIELDEIMRQREDVEFATVLNYLRVRTIDEQISNEALTVLRDCIREGPEDALHVYSTNDEVNDFNLEKLQTCCANFIEVDAEDYQKDKTTGRLKLREKPLITTKTDGLSSSLLLAVNARVMLTRNVSVEDGLVNGAMGYISHFEFGRDHQRKNIQGVEVIFDSKEIGKLHGTMTPHGNRIVIKRIQEEIKEKNTKNVVRHQFPLKLSWACTAHKVQGMTTDKVVVNLDRTFAAGQAYVAISRVTSKDGLYIETADEDKLKRKIYADPDVKTSLSIMQKFVPSGVGEIGQIQTEECKTILLLNVQSLRAHMQDIKSDNRLTNTDLICLTETWLKNQEDLSEFDIPGFNFHSISRGMCYNDSSNTFRKLSQARGGGIGVFQRKEENMKVHELPQKNIEGMALELCKLNIVIIVIYRPGNINVGFFLDALHNIIEYYQKHRFQCVVVGDFNEDARSKGPITSYLQSKGFEQKVDFSTTEGGTILDHIYVTKGMSVKVVKVPVYFSYHDAIKVYLQGTSPVID
ncbi:uncharacterized protein LOC128177537 [Crassostrea angulata]|uniref:uncharacterized protein LOC128177537 n=1 Tax=Magallana angulata TaxID=2784310 RepID=UPI0022B1E9A1|nr:uncharacterized protein LOC128177537 [Crassostrea angulata]